MGPVRTEVMWQAVQDAVAAARSGIAARPGTAASGLDVLDLGGGTGSDAVRLAAEGHRVVVVDPSPDALASLHRRAVEAGAESSVRGVQGDSADLSDHVPAASMDLVLCHGLLEHVDDPVQTLTAVASTLRPDGRLSVVVANRLAAVVARALAGDFTAAAEVFGRSAAQWSLRDDGPRRFVDAEVAALLTATGFVVEASIALRVFADLVPAAIVDAEPGARDRLFALERLVKSAPEFRALSAGLQSIARLDLASGTPNPGGKSAAL